MAVFIYHGDKITADENLKQRIKDAVAVGMEVTDEVMKLARNCHKPDGSVVMYRHGAAPITSTHAKEVYPAAEFTAWAIIKNLKTQEIDFLMFYF